MSNYGLQVWNSLGQKRLDTSDKVPKLFDSINVKGPPSSSVNMGMISWSDKFTYWYHYRYFWNVPYPQIALDGKWSAVFKHIPKYTCAFGPGIAYYATSVNVVKGGLTITAQIVGDAGQINTTDGFVIDIYRL